MVFFTDLIDRIRLPFRKDKESYYRLYKILGFYPHNIHYYKQAFIHKSSNKKGNKEEKLNNNERLEFLGDAILDAIVGDIVYQHFQGKREGFLTNTRSKIVQRDTLNKIANEIGLNKLVKYDMNNVSHNSYMGGNAFEALVGAVYLDRGYDYCMRFMRDRIIKQLINIDKVAYKEVNFKSKIIEWSQKNKVKTHFDLVKETRDEKGGSPVFYSEVIIEGICCGKGNGYSKKESQQLASKEALKKLKRNPKLIDEIFAIKSQRTAMEEEPTAIPEIETNTVELEVSTVKAEVKEETPALPKETIEPETRKEEGSNIDFDLSDISLQKKELTKEEIIAAAEAAAFEGNA
ncbi:MAG: ribonuclease III [Bacteroidaceae bacterium]|nr:ribonuclease III [Bacteroidaceae bacterium]